MNKNDCPKDTPEGSQVDIVYHELFVARKQKIRKTPRFDDVTVKIHFDT